MSQSKTEEPTPKRLREARRRGEAPQSRELTRGVGLLAFAGALAAWGDDSVRELAGCARLALGAVEGGLASEPTAVLAACTDQGARAVLPSVAVAAGAAGLASFLQVGPLFAPRTVLPEPARLDPAKNAQQLLGAAAWVQLGKSLLVLALLVAAVWGPFEDALRGVGHLPSRDAAGLLEAFGVLVPRVVVRAGVVLLGVGVLDLVHQRWRFREDRRMSLDEVRREHRESEGEPHAKQERARLHREIVEHQVLEEVRRADVLVVNPTHLAVALRYDGAAGDPESDAVPEVVAKGREGLARRMIDAAREAGVPVLRDVPLARSLFELEVGDAIPEALYEAVAAVLHAAWDERRAADPEAEGP